MSVKDITWNGAVIPAGTTFFLNAYAANHDASHFARPEDFDPERYLKNTESDESATEGTPHYGYGAGSRMCPGTHLANRELYTAMLRLIVGFHILPGKNPHERPVLDALGANAIPNSQTLDPKPFKCGFKARDPEALERWIRRSEERTSGLQ